MSQHQFVWLDLETTGLDPHAPGAAILEWAIVLAADDRDGDMSEVERMTSLVRPTGDPTASMDPYVVEMHTKNGLLDELAGCGYETPDTAETDAILAAWAEAQAPGKGRLTLAGASVHFDLAWIRVHFPRFAAKLSHRVFDVSTLKAAERAWAGPFADAPRDGAHRALPDVLASLAEAKAIRQARWEPGTLLTSEAERAARLAGRAGGPV
jgi:oligoribonuclease